MHFLERIYMKDIIQHSEAIEEVKAVNLGQNPHRIREPREKVLELAIGREVKTHRRQRSMTVADLATSTGLSIGMLSKLRMGIRLHH